MAGRSCFIVWRRGGGRVGRVGGETVVEGGEGGDVWVREEVREGGVDGCGCLGGVTPGAAVEVALLGGGGLVGVVVGWWGGYGGKGLEGWEKD